MEPIIFVAAIVIAFLTAIIAGMIGGSFLILIPALVFLGIDIHEVIGISKVLIIAAGLAFINYMKGGKFNLKFSWPYALLIAGGSVIGSFIVIGVSKSLLQKMIAVIMIIIALFILGNKNFGVKLIKTKIKKKYIILAMVLMFVLGIYEGFYAAASSIMMIMIFSGLLKKDFVESIGNTRFVDLAGGIAATAVFAAKGLINFKLAIPLGIVFFAGSWIGSHITLKKGSAWVRYLVITLAIAFAIKLLFFG